MTDLELGIRLFLQLAVVLLACRVVGWLGRFFGQTQVVSEMICGVILGPSLFGALAPAAQGFLFPRVMEIAQNGVTVTAKHPSMQILYAMSQVGLVLYMFLVGLEFDLNLIRKRALGAVSVSIAGILFPFVLGWALGVWVLFPRGDSFTENVVPWQAGLYLGAAMCITAFPMLARIIYEKGIAKTSMGTLALGAGATDDAVAWGMLAVVLSSFRGDATIAMKALGGAAVFAVLTLTLGRRLLERILAPALKSGTLTPIAFGIVLTYLMFCAWYTDVIGIYAVFGAFLAGASMPRGVVQEWVETRVGPLTTTLLLPLFFIYSGLNTKISLVDSWELWGVTALICVAAIVGKGVACTLAAKAAGEPWREATAIGTLMNARGLMELIILNIAYEAGLITQLLFTMMVIMAIVTTLMASPLFQRIYYGPKTASA
ncbi:MAG: cation:proton antiporter [Fimbriimonadaceae bacterium]